MGHLLSMMFFAMLLAGAGTLVVQMLRADAARILDALAMASAAPAPRPWPARVRMVGAMRPTAIRAAARRATA